MKVLLMQTHYTHSRCVPLSIAYIAAVLEKNKHTVNIYDPPPYEKFNIKDELRRFNPDMVGISCMSATFNRALSIAREIKNFNQDTLVVFGGIHATALPKETISNKEVDYVVIGEGEYTFLELLEALDNKKTINEVNGLCHKKDGCITVNAPRPLMQNLDELPFPARHLFPKWYFMRWMCMRGRYIKGTNMMSARGCPYDCSYCASKVMFGRNARFISPKKVVDEIEHLVKEHGMKAITFSDDTFSVNEKRAIEMCNEIKKRGLDKIKFRVQLRANTVSENLLKNLKEAGCIQVDVGVESGSQRILNILNKNITTEQARNAFKLFKKYKLNTCATFMIGNPTETLDDIEMTRALAKEINADYTQFFITTPYPGTKLYEDVMKSTSKINIDNLHHGGAELTSYIKSEIPPKKLIMLQKELNEEFLKKAGIKMISPLLIADTILLAAQKPRLLKDAMLNAYKTKRVTEAYRILYEGHNFRKPLFGWLKNLFKNETEHEEN